MRIKGLLTGPLFFLFLAHQLIGVEEVLTIRNLNYSNLKLKIGLSVLTNDKMILHSMLSLV